VISLPIADDWYAWQKQELLSNGIVGDLYRGREPTLHFTRTLSFQSLVLKRC